jgi:TorA maturation chaperone TorD
MPVVGLTLAGQALLQSNPSAIHVPEDAEGALADEIRLAQAAPEAAELEYGRLFLNPLGAVCHFWQSVYANESRIFGPAHHSALDWYRRYGAEPQNTNEPADHLGLLLLFYARLIEAGESAETIDTFQREHIAWAAQFGAKLRQEARHPLYLALARDIQSISAQAI